MSLPFDAPAAEPKGLLISLIFAGDILSPFSDLQVWGCGHDCLGRFDELFSAARLDIGQH